MIYEITTLRARLENERALIRSQLQDQFIELPKEEADEMCQRLGDVITKLSFLECPVRCISVLEAA